MDNIAQNINQLLADGSVDIFLGYVKGNDSRAKAAFFNISDKADNAIFDASCTQNLAVYLHKHEIKSFAKIGIFANYSTLRAIIQLANENQIKEEKYIIQTMNKDGKIITFANLTEVESYVQANRPAPAAAMIQKLDSLSKMDRDERWEFWSKELASCIKCYACRSACPMCYCSQCTTDCNQPQWIGVPAHGQGNFEWHIMRAMHLAGRCVACGECQRVCPMEIPLGLLNARLNIDIATNFGETAGMNLGADYALSSYKVDDKEHFIR